MYVGHILWRASGRERSSLIDWTDVEEEEDKAAEEEEEEEYVIILLKSKWNKLRLSNQKLIPHF